jgi:hypothetical protein
LAVAFSLSRVVGDPAHLKTELVRPEGCGVLVSAGRPNVPGPEKVALQGIDTSEIGVLQGGDDGRVPLFRSHPLFTASIDDAVRVVFVGSFPSSSTVDFVDPLTAAVESH